MRTKPINRTAGGLMKETGKWNWLFLRRRTVRGLLVNPQAQLKYSFVAVASGLIILAIFLATILAFLNQTFAILQDSYGLDPQAGESVRSMVANNLWMGLGFAVLLGVMTFAMGIKFSHRIYGPMVPIQLHIAELKKGNYESRIKLRKHDQFTDVKDSLNELAQLLANKSGNS
jgi:hypothetical protein